MTALSPTERRDGRVVLAWLVGFFVSFIIVDAIMVTIAVRTQPGVVTDQAYERGLAYNTAIAAAEDQAARGWRGDITVEDKTIRFTLVDRDGSPISGTHVTGRLIRPVVDGIDMDVSFTSMGEGRYETQLNAPALGKWDIVVNAIYHDIPFVLRKSILLK